VSFSAPLTTRAAIAVAIGVFGIVGQALTGDRSVIESTWSAGLTSRCGYADVSAGRASAAVHADKPDGREARTSALW
jgi:hypothetical protein